MDVFYFYTCVTAVKHTVFQENMTENESYKQKEISFEIKILIEFEYLSIQSMMIIQRCYIYLHEQCNSE